MRVDNVVANELLVSVRGGKRLDEFMDAVSGVKKYRLDDENRQGHIRSMFIKELIKNQFIIQFDEMISTFWQAVFENINKAKLWGEIVEIKLPGGKTEIRETQLNPIHYLRRQGRFAVRNYINKQYHNNLEHHCHKCGYRNVVSHIKVCPDCGHELLIVYKFDNEDNIQLETRDYENVDNKQVFDKIKMLADEFAESVLGRGTRAHQIFNILINPRASRQICGACKLCDATVFDIEVCTNYNSNIGKFFGVNKSMIASKVVGIRRRFSRWLKEQNSDEARYLYERIPARY